MDLDEGWELASAAPGSCRGPGDLAALDWLPAQVPGTAAGSVGAGGRDFDAEDWWFRCRFAVPDDLLDVPAALELDGIATLSEVFLNGELVLESGSMWQCHEVEATGRLRAESELVICCRALTPLLAKRRRPAARWRTRVVNAGNLRWFRTMIFGRSPGFAPGPAAVGPWRPIRLVDRSRPGLRSLTISARPDGGRGLVTVRARARGNWDDPEISVGEQRAGLEPDGDGGWQGQLTVEDVSRWWPHTHGEPALHDLALNVGGTPVATRRIGFRELDWTPDIPESGLDLRVNKVPIFVRGAVWTPADLVSLAPTGADLRGLLERVRDAGMNMVRVVGTGAYESPAFHDLCDELGILVWQDLMFANLDYPVTDPQFAQEAQREARQILAGLAWRPSLAVVCGNSEVEQQPAMMGLDPQLGRDPLWDEVLGGVVSESGADCPYIRSTPCGGVLPFHPDRGVTHYFGVSGYFRELGDARRAQVRFASECLAFANVPDEVDVPVHHPHWKEGVARDAGTGWDLGAGWDFDDVRDYYLALLYGVDPVQLRRSDHTRYLELSRAASGEVMAEVMGEWRRAGSACRGALVLWLKDMLPGAGLGVLDHRGLPKVAYHHLRRALSPLAVWTTDEGVAGIAVHIANDRGLPAPVRLRVALYRDLEARVAQAEELLELAPHQTIERSVEGLLGSFFDVAWAYRFGPPTADAIVVSLESAAGPPQLLSQALRFPAGRPASREPAARMQIELGVQATGQGDISLTMAAARLVYGARLEVPGFVADDDAFSIEPGRPRTLALHPIGDMAAFKGGALTALNVDGPIKIPAV
jgi:beta-mannosidase